MDDSWRPIYSTVVSLGIVAGSGRYLWYTALHVAQGEVPTGSGWRALLPKVRLLAYYCGLYVGELLLLVYVAQVLYNAGVFAGALR